MFSPRSAGSLRPQLELNLSISPALLFSKLPTDDSHYISCHDDFIERSDSLSKLFNKFISRKKVSAPELAEFRVNLVAVDLILG